MGAALERSSSGQIDHQDVIESFEEDERLSNLEIDADDLPKNTKLTAKKNGDDITIKFPSSASPYVEESQTEDGNKRIVIIADRIEEPKYLEK